MPFKLKEGAETDGLPTITLAGTSYFIARLPLRHRIAVAVLLPKLRMIISRLPSVDDIKAGAAVDFTEEDYLILVDIVRHGIAKLYPGASREALLDEDIDMEDLFAAWPTVMQQGASRRHAAGEVSATNSSSQNSGDGSSPISP